jgi:hypothetical protein
VRNAKRNPPVGSTDLRGGNAPLYGASVRLYRRALIALHKKTMKNKFALVTRSTSNRHAHEKNARSPPFSPPSFRDATDLAFTRDRHH